MKKSFKPWTKEENALFSKDLSNAQIAEKTGRPLSAISNKRFYMKSRTGNGDGEFTAQDKRIILTTASNEEAAERIGATVDSVVAMREWLAEKEEPQVRMAAKPKVHTTEDISAIMDETFDEHLIVRFGDSTMILKKDEISSIQIGDSGIVILK